MIAKIDPATAKSAPPIYQLKITLLGTKPAVWRRLQVPGNANLAWLHAVLQVAMGWTNSHLHHFLTSEGRYADPRITEDMGLGGQPDRDEAKAALSEVLSEAGGQCGYEYDFGDSWMHEVTVERILPTDPTAVGTAVCLGGAGACPPEDCGGIGGYADLIRILRKPKHPEHKEMKAWVGGAIDSQAFDREHINVWLRKLKWPRVTQAQLRKVLMGRDDYREE